MSASASEPFLLVVNPRAGAGRAERRLPRLTEALHALGASFDVARTSSPGDATKLVREALKAGMRGVAVVGGDGTLNEATNGFFDDEGNRVGMESAWLAPMSCGTGGDFRKTIKSVNVGPTGSGIEELAARVMAAAPRSIDVGWLRFVDNGGRSAERAFLNITSFGIGGLVDKLVNETPKWMGGGPAFFAGTLRALARYRNQRVRVALDDGPFRETEIVNMAVANGQYFGGGMYIAPTARIDDALFDVVGLEHLTPARSFGLTRHIYGGTHIGRDGVTHARATRVFAEPAVQGEAILLDVDGEAPGRLPATFTMKPGALLLRG